MQFKDLPEDIQKIAADTLKAHLSVLDLTKEPKANLENISRNVRDVFVGLYAYDNEKHEEHIQNGCINKFQQNIKLPVADKTEQKTDVLVFWNTVEAIAGARCWNLTTSIIPGSTLINHHIVRGFPFF
ncbi:hypothetical protein AB6H37_RS13400 [Escherichia coli]